MFREQEEGQTDDAVELHHRAEHDAERRPGLLLALYGPERHQEQGHPLAGAQRGVLHGKEQQPCQCHEPQKHTHPHRFPRKGSHYQREHRSVVVDVEVFGIFGIERLAVYGVPEHVAEHQEVVVVAVAQLRHCHQCWKKGFASNVFIFFNMIAKLRLSARKAKLILIFRARVGYVI